MANLKKCPVCEKEKTESKAFRQLQRAPVVYSDKCLACLHIEEKADMKSQLAERRLERRKQQRADNEIRRLSRIEQNKLRSDEPVNKTKNEAERELIRRTLARRHLIRFIQRFERNYDAGWFHYDVCRRLESFLEKVMAGLSPCLMLFAPPRHGKQLADFIEVFTKNGWKRHGDLVPGDFVFSPNGTPVKVLAVSEKTFEKVDINFTDGSTITCHPNHEWTVYDRSLKRWRTVETKFLQKKVLFHEGGKGKKRARFQLPLISPVELPEKELIVHPYVLGARLGDGSSYKPAITHTPEDIETINRVVQLGYEIKNTYTHKTTGVDTTYFSGIEKDLKAINVWDNKHIPREYIESSIEQRLQFLAGLIDTDGSVDQKSGRVRIINTNENIVDGAIEIIRSFGWHACKYRQEPALSSSGIQGVQPVFYVGFNPDMDIPTCVPRKKLKRLVKRRRVGVKSVTPAPPAPGQCIQVDSPDGLYLVGREMIPTHNSEIFSKKFPAWALGHYPELNFIAASYAVSLPLFFSRHIRSLLRDPRYQVLFPGTKLDPEFQGVESWMTTEGGIYIPTGVGGGIAGKGADILLMDDPVKDAEEADSESMREKTWTWYGSEAHTRLSPKSGQLLMMTRRHDDDMAGRAVLMMESAKSEIKEVEESLLDDLAKKDLGEMEKLADLEGIRDKVNGMYDEIDDWEVVSYPAIAETDEWLNLDDTVTDEPKDEDSVFLRSKGEALHPERYTKSRLMRKKRIMHPRHWSALFQQNPIPEEGLFFKKEMLRYTPTETDWRGMPIIITGDLAISEKQTADYTAFCVCAVDAEDRLHILEVVRGHWGTFEIVDVLINLYVKYSRGAYRPIVGLERGQLEKAIMPVLQKAMRKRRLYMNMDNTLKPVTDKLVRARPLQGRMQQGMVCFPSGPTWVDMVVQELLRFPGGLHDDMVDALAWASRIAANINPPKFKGKRKKGDASLQKKLNDYMRQQKGAGKSKHFMAA